MSDDSAPGEWHTSPSVDVASFKVYRIGTIGLWQAYLVRLASLVGMGKRLGDHFRRRALETFIHQSGIKVYGWEDEFLGGTGDGVTLGVLADEDDQAKEVDHD